jgi:hypothetical protein
MTKKGLTIALLQGYDRQRPNHKASPYGLYKRNKTLYLEQPQSPSGQALSDHLSPTGEVWERLFLLAHRICDDIPWAARTWRKISVSGCQSSRPFSSTVSGWWAPNRWRASSACSRGSWRGRSEGVEPSQYRAALSGWPTTCLGSAPIRQHGAWQRQRE